MPQDDLTHIRQFRDDLRALKAQYPELTTPAAQRRLEDYMSTQTDVVYIPTERKESPMPARGDRTLGEDLATLTFKVQVSVMDTIEKHLRMLQRTTRYQRIGRSDALRDIFLRGIDSIENPPQQFPIELDAPQLPLPSRSPVEPAAAAAVSQDDVPRRRRVATPLDEDIENMPLEPTAVAQDSVVPAATVKAARPKAAAKKRTTSTTKGR